MASEKITAIVDSIAELTVLELKELKETIEETFGVTAAAVAVAAAPAEGGRRFAAAAIHRLLRRKRADAHTCGRGGFEG